MTMTEAQNIVKPYGSIVKSNAICGRKKPERFLPARRTTMPEYTSWLMMHHRCYNTKRRDYKWYGARGIEICKRWRDGDGERDGFECFFLDMGVRPEGKGTIDRKNGDGHYCPENCIWENIAPQQRHKSSTVYLEFRGERLCRAEMAKKYGIPFSALRERTEVLGWDLGKALLTPSIPIKKIGVIEHNGQSKTIREWAAQYGLKYATLLTRLKRGMPMATALTAPLKRS